MISLRLLFKNWNDFWFSDRSPLPMAVCRVLIGFLVLLVGFQLLPDLLVWFGERGILSLQTAKQIAAKPQLNVLSVIPQGDGWVMLFYAVFMVFAFMLTVGLWTRFSAFMVWVGLLSFYNRNPMLFNNAGDNFLRIVVFFLIFSDAGSMLSLDCLLKKNGEKEDSTGKSFWVQRLLQLQLVAFYLVDFCWKWQNAEWASGHAAYLVSRVDAFWLFPVPPLFDHIWMIRLFTWGVMVFELLFVTLVWVDEFRYVILGAGVLFHLLCLYTVNLPLLNLVLLAAYLTFIDPKSIQEGIQRIRLLAVRRPSATAQDK